jgi:maltooligosyltrehalose trehalohydrolase
MPPEVKTGNNGYRFTVWAPEKKQMTLHIVKPFDRQFAMQKAEEGYFTAEVESDESLQYFYQPEGEKDFPDPASAYQPQGVHGPSQTVDHSTYQWHDGHWKGLPLHDLVIYELHVGTFTPEGSFEAIIPRLDDLKNLGVNALELMPVAQFPGSRNWGYDGVFPYAVQNSYGGPDGLKSLVDACHQKGIAVFLDVVYNHLGPEGNYFSPFGPYFTNKYCTPWGDAINYDDAWSDGVREYFSDNIIYWLEQFHIDGLRCDAIHAVFDNGAVHFWQLAHQKVKALEEKLGKRFYLMAESDLNSPRVIAPPDRGGYGFDAQWLDDFHHALYVLVNQADKERYYDFGAIQQLAKAYTDGFVHSGEWVKFRKRKHGASSAGIPGERFIAFNLNHDQVGNRPGGERLCMLVKPERVKLAAAALLLSPYLPLLFMGEEYSDKTPFYYFVSHSDKDLIKAVQEGRKEEFKDFGFGDEIPDPQAETTFLQSKIHWEQRNEPQNQIILQWHKHLIELRRSMAALKNSEKTGVSAEIIAEYSLLLVRRSADERETLYCFFNFGEAGATYQAPPGLAAEKILDSKDTQWQAEDEKQASSHPAQLASKQPLQLAPASVVVYRAQAVVN